MSVGWEVLPMLPLRCVLDYLSTEDAINALSVCSHWRAHVTIYEGHRDTLKLRANQLEKNLFLARIFRKHTRRLHIYLDCNNKELDKFMTYVLPQFFDSVNLHEVIFIGPSYIKQDTNMSSTSSIKLKRILTESLILKHLHSLHRLAYFGCEMDTAINDNDRYTNELTEYYSRRFSFTSEPIAADSIMLSCNTSSMMYSTLQHLIVDYEQINTESLQTLSNLPKIIRLSLNIMNKREMALHPIDWRTLQANYPDGLEVSVNIIGLPYKKLDLVIKNVLVEGLNLVSLKVLFCKTLYTLLLAHVSAVHKSTIRELVWSDSPHDSKSRVVRDVSTQNESCNMNPFMLLCWQCQHLQRLVIHGYYIWQYDILGFVRLRNTLQHLEISSIYGSIDGYEADIAVRVLTGDSPWLPRPEFVEQVNEFTEFKWSPLKWADLHPALKARPTPEQRGEYIIQECALGGT